MHTKPINDVVEATFNVEGATLPLDHGYPLFAALSRILPQLHETRTWGIHTIPGRQDKPGLLRLDGRSILTIRLPTSDIGQLVPLVGIRLDVAGHSLKVSHLQIHRLQPVSTLWAKFVTYRGHQEPAPFLDCLKRHLAEVESLSQDPERVGISLLQRKVMRIKEKAIVGFRVELSNLEPVASLRVQQEGLGGRRHMGAGLFIPTTRLSL